MPDPKMKPGPEPKPAAAVEEEPPVELAPRAKQTLGPVGLVTTANLNAKVGHGA